MVKTVTKPVISAQSVMLMFPVNILQLQVTTILKTAYVLYANVYVSIKIIQTVYVRIAKHYYIL